MQILLTHELKAELYRKGVDSLWAPGSVALPADCLFEPPCSIKWMSIAHACTLGAFSYAVSGWFFACHIGRYVSIGEGVQAGRGDHPTDWLSTSPFQYLHKSEVFETGSDFAGGGEFAGLGRVSASLTRAATRIKPIEIGHDVWIGHGAFIKPGITIGNGAIVGAHAVVTRDVPAYAVVAGNPARIRRMRFDDSVIERLEQLQWWRFALWDLKDVTFDRVDRALDDIALRIAENAIQPYVPGFIHVGALDSATLRQSA
jgi:acetyltransferase-like isoleucine patch superfamily enzyme